MLDPSTPASPKGSGGSECPEPFGKAIELDWMPKVDGIISGEEPGEPGCIPLEVCDAIIADSRGSELR